MKYLLDTCVVSETRRREPNTNLMNWLAERKAADLFISVVTLGELRKGACSLKEASRRQVLEKWIDEDVATSFSGRILSFERSIADQWGRLMGEGIAKGLTPSVTDSMLAATALARGMAIVTRNVSDFQFEGLQVVNPFGGPAR